MAMRRQLSGKISGTNPLAYVGSTPNMVFNTRRPTTRDFFGFELGTWWIIPRSTNGSSLSEEIWILIGLDNNIATWKRIHSGGGPSETASVITTVYDTPGSFTHTFDSNMVDVQVECVGGGASGISYVTGPQGSTGLSGSGGGYCKKLFSSSIVGTSQPLVIGAGGASVTTATGNPGGNTTFGSFMTANGATAPSIIMGVFTVSVAGSATGGDINIPGQSVGSATTVNVAGFMLDSAGNFPVSGGNSFMGFGGISFFNTLLNSGPGQDGTGYGSGGGVGLDPASSGAGANGVIIITEYLG